MPQTTLLTPRALEPGMVQRTSTRILMLLVALGLVVAGLLATSNTEAGAGTARPATADTTLDVDRATAAVPQCVKTHLDDDGFTDYLKVHNKCRRQVRVKVVIANGNDFACQPIRSGQVYRYQWSWPGRFDRLERC